MRGPYESAQEEFQAMCVEALQAAYPHLSVEHLATLCAACGVTVKQAFPWTKETTK
jgi:hypothetical protein